MKDRFTMGKLCLPGWSIPRFSKLGRLLLFLPILLGMMAPQQSKASHFAGGEISYQNVINNTYLVTLKLYRDCAGIPFGTQQTLQVSPGNSGSSFSLPLVSTTDITLVCPGQTSRCQGGTISGVQELVFRTNINFNLLPPGQFYTLSNTACCRNAVITSLSTPGSQGWYISTTLNPNLNPKDNSPTFLNRPVAYMCAGQPATLSPNAVDIDGDAIQYSLVPCRQTATNPVNYMPGFSATNPFASTNGFTFNNFTGELRFTPSSPQVGVVCMQADEYRNGALIGSITRDIQVVVRNCNNNCPVISQLNSRIVNVGQTYCIAVNAVDADMDDITLTAVSNVGTFTLTNSGPGFADGTFCFTPTLAHAGRTFTITINAADNSCGGVCTQSTTFNITVPFNCNATATATSTPASCGSNNGTAAVSTTGLTAPLNYTWSNGASTASLSGLAAGTYSVTVVGGNSCVANASVTVALQGGNIAATTTTQDPSCPGQNDGAITVSANGGNAPYSYSLNGGSPQASNVFSNLGAGNYTIMVTDAGGCNSAPLSVTLSANDNVAPVPNCPASFSVANDPGLCEAVVNYNLSATDNCGNVTTAQTAGIASGSSFPVGTTVNKFKFTDAAGNVSTCSFSVTVIDQEAPIVNCPGSIKVANDPGLCSAVVNFNVSASDNCGHFSSVQNAGLASGSVFPVGTTLNSISFFDGAGNRSNCTFEVKVVDQEVPVVTCPASMKVKNAFGRCDAVVNYQVQFSDNCAVVSRGLVSGLPSGSTFPVGTTTNTFQVSDAAGNTSTCSFDVTIVDAQAPTITCPTNISVSNDQDKCSALVKYGVSGSDNCGGYTITQTAGLPTLSNFPVGLTVNTFVITAANGQTATCSFSVKVGDTEDPVAVCKDATVQLDANGQASITAAQINDGSSDNCGIASMSLSQTNFTCADLGLQTVTLTVVDLSNTSSTCTATVKVEDNIAPTITCPADEAYTCAQGIPAANTNAVSATDNCGIMSIDHVGDQDNGGSGCAGDPRIVIRSYSATDFAGNSVTCSQTITIESTPVIATASNDVTVTPLISGQECANISVAATGGCAPYSYSWSNGSTAASQSVCPSITTTYVVTVTDAQGCEAIDSVLVCVIDISCGNGNGPQSLIICHVPPGNPNNATTLCLSAQAAQAHINQGHGGDYWGPCGGQGNNSCLGNGSRTSAGLQDNLPGLSLAAVPNPFGNSTTIHAQFGQACEASLMVYDLQGRIVGSLFEGAVIAGQELELEFQAEGLSKGLYLARLRTSNGENQVLRLMLQ